MTTTTTHVLDLQYADDPRTAGTKAATLARLLRDGFPVPDGVVLIPEAAEDGADVAAAVRRLGDIPLAIRSSAVDEDLPDASYAGLYTTVLNVTGDGLADAVRQCWASASGERVRSYRPGTGETPRIALLIQPMVPAEAAGVAFTADPITGDRGVVVVEAVAGLGERLVSGEAAPDAWEVRDATTIRRTTAGEPVLDADQARAVAVLARRVEQHEGRPQDIEWALCDGKLVLLQARPVTTLTIEPVPVPAEPPPGYWTREDSHAPVPWSRFTRAVLAARTPAIRRMCTDLGLLFDTVEFRDIGGWEYVRIVPLGGKDRPAPPARLVPLLFRLVPMLRRRVATSVKAAQSDVVGRLVRRWYEEWQPQFAARIAELRDVPMAELTDQELGHHFVRAMSLIREGVEVHMRLHGPIQIALAELVFTCRDLLGWNEAQTFELLAGLSQTSTEPSRAIGRIAALAQSRRGASVEALLDSDEPFATAFTDFLRTHGCRALRYEVAEQNLDERPELVLGLISDQIAAGFDPARTDAALAARRESAASEARRRLSPSDLGRFDRALARAVDAYPVREDNEYFTTSAPLALVRRVALEVGRRLADRGQLPDRDDVFRLSPTEAEAALRDGSSCHDIVGRARGERAWVLAHPGPVAYGKDPGPPPSLKSLPAEARLMNEAFLWAVERILAPGDARHGAADAAITGIAASPGSFTGPVRIIRDEAEFDRLRAGDVLVCPVTSPVWSVLFPSIGALVTDTGGTLSHPAIIAREYGIPAVVNTGTGTSALQDGQMVTVDGNAGTVRIVS
jgi:phosphohistidine swiveling domain-containing protein